MLRTLNENPKSAERVLNAFAREFESWNFLERLNWEQGKGNRGESFIRLRLSQNNDAGKSSGRTELSIGSDGRVSADHTKDIDSFSQSVKAAAALSLLGRIDKSVLDKDPKPLML